MKERERERERDRGRTSDIESETGFGTFFPDRSNLCFIESVNDGGRVVGEWLFDGGDGGWLWLLAMVGGW